MTQLQQGSGGREAQPRLRDGAWLLASVLAHTLLLVGIVVFGSPRLFATVSPQPIVVEIVPQEELAKGKLVGGAAQPAQQAKPQQTPPQEPQAQQQRQAQPQAQPRPAAAAAPVFASLYPWPVTQRGDDVQVGDYRTFESTGKLDHPELARFKARLKECWRPPSAGSGRKLTAALRVAFRVDGTLAGPPELVEVTASPEAIRLVTSAKQALAECGPYGFLPAESYDAWKALSLTFSPDDIQVASVTR